MRIEADNLQEAFSKAAQQLNCSVTELDIKVIQHPRGGVFGMFKKTAIIEATREGEQPKRERPPRKRKERAEREERSERPERQERQERTDKKEPKRQENVKKDESPAVEGEEKPSPSKRRRNRRNRNRRKNKETENTTIETVDQVREQEQVVAKKAVQDAPVIPTVQDESPETLEIPYADLKMNTEEVKQEPAPRKERVRKPKEVTPKVDMAVAVPAITEGVTRLINSSCFAIEDIKVEAFDEETVLIEFNGEDAALLIGKEGYRYKAFSYLLYNWVNIKFGLGIRLEIAEFLKNQEEMIDKYLVPVVERINTNGRGQTKPLDGVLIKIALERLRTQFPEKYVGIKSGREGGKFVVVNDFNRKNS